MGYACAPAGLTRARRVVWVTARVVEVRPPGHGEPGERGIPVTIAYQDPGTGREFGLRHEDGRGDRVLVARVGQEFPVSVAAAGAVVDLVLRPAGDTAEPIRLQTLVSKLRFPRTGDQVPLVRDPANPGGCLSAGDRQTG